MNCTDDEEGCMPLLQTSEELNNANNVTISELFTTALNMLWPEVIQYYDVLLYMNRAARSCKKNLFQQCATCLAHCFHCIVEEVII